MRGPAEEGKHKGRSEARQTTRPRLSPLPGWFEDRSAVRFRTHSSQAFASRPADNYKPRYPGRESNRRNGQAGNCSRPAQGRQDERHGPLTVEVVYKPPTTPNNRFFMTKAQQEKLQRAALLGKRVTIELMTAAADRVEDNPEMFVDLVEIEVNWKAE